MAKAMKVSAGKAGQYYYEKDPICAKEGLGSNLTWFGTGAETLGLSGKLHEANGLESFTNLLYGLTPDGSSRLVGHETGAKSHDKNSATDIPLTLSKSFGIVALEDPQAREAISRVFHNVAERIEDHVFGRQTVDGETSQVKGQMIAVLAEHSVSRAGDTHPHGHLVIMNNVIRPDGTHSTLENFELMKAQSSIQQDLYNEVAREFKSLGYAIETSKVGNHVIPEVAGIDKETRDLFSKRHHEIKNASELKESLRERMPNASDIRIDNLAQLLTKNAKDQNLTEREVVDSHREQVSAAGKSLPVMISEAKAMGQSATHEQHTADDYVRFAIQDEQEKESVFSSRSIINSAIRLGCGDVIRSEVEEAFNKAVQSGELVKLGRDSRGNEAFSTPQMIAIEKQIAVATVDEANKFSPLLTPEQTEKAIQTFQAEKGWQVSAGQRNAIETVLQSSGRLAIIQGDAGAGKSTAFECINNALKDIPGLEVKGLGFQGKASAELERSSGIASQTVHSFLAEKKTPSHPRHLASFGSLMKPPCLAPFSLDNFWNALKTKTPK
ncbi:MAG: MobF family relaxase [Desulfuromonadaceae bacterium]|nr:MobF family relaxase [Desulfuromonadaceae bacterium]